MQILDPTVFATFLAIVAVAVLAGAVLAAVTVVSGLTITRRERIARHESIPNYYGRLHFAR